jgi:Mrp family chromosome partitioning ATPase
VAVVASEGSVEAGWAASAALDIARAWSASGLKVIVADGALHYPTLHTHAKVDNGEGLSDAALFGVSVGRVARPVDDGAFFLITAGTAVANANSVPSSPRWSRLLEGFVEAGVRLVLFVRDGDSGSAAFLGSASDIVVLAGRDEKAPAAVRDLEGLVRAVTGPGGAAARTVRASVATAASASGLRPPEEWTATTPAGKQRVLLLVIFVVVLIAALVMFFTSIDLSSLAPEETGAARPPAAEVLTEVA